MKIVGGNYGSEGAARVDAEKGLVIENSESENIVYPPEQIHSVTVDSVKERTFDRTAYLVGSIAAIPLCASFAGWYGIPLGLVLAIPCGYHAGRQKIVIVHFEDDKFIRVECAPEDMYELKEMRGSASRAWD